LSSINVRNGQNIDRNNRIGAVGNTGLSLEPNLTVFFVNRITDLKAIYFKNK
jgi:murein DD-endopeptidase MepM/ murein hydrolase activator NlpD